MFLEVNVMHLVHRIGLYKQAFTVTKLFHGRLSHGVYMGPFELSSWPDLRVVDCILYLIGSFSKQHSQAM